MLACLLDVTDTREINHILSRILFEKYNRIISRDDQMLCALESIKVESSTFYFQPGGSNNLLRDK